MYKDIKKELPCNKQRYLPKAELGLSSQQVQQRIADGFTNFTVDAPSKTVKQIIYSNVFTYFNLVFVVLAIFILIVGSYQNLMFLGVVIINTIIGIVQEIRAKRTIDKLTVLSSPNAKVLRDGKIKFVPTEKLVLDDVVIFSAGQQICADAVILDGEVEVNEGLVTGEADAIKKGISDALLSGSFVVSGECRARLDKVGADSFASRLTVEAKRHKRIESEMMRSLNRLIKVIGIIIIPFGVLMYLNQKTIPGMTPNYAVVSTVASLIAMIPEGLYLLVSVALAVSVMRLASHKTLVHELYCIETLARVDVLCLDKTGTITTGEMQVSDLVVICPESYSNEEISKIISAFYKCSKDENETAKALREKFNDKVDWQANKIVAFSSSRKWSAVEFKSQGTYVIGAPDFVLANKYSEDYKKKVDEYASEGKRVLLLAKHDGKIIDEKLNCVSPIAFIIIQDKIRNGAKKTLQYFYEQDVDIKIISGDDPLTVSRIAKRAGVKNFDKFIDCKTLSSKEDVIHAANEYTVFGRVSPEQKRMLINALKKQGHTVAMTGDGVNDVLALKDADCSIAMASGSDAACQVSQLVLMDSNFSSMPKVVLEGRRVINNIERAASLFLVKTIYSSIFTLLSIFFSLAYPFVPIQLSLISALTIGVPSFFLALEPNKSRVSGKFLSNVFSKALPAGLTNLVSMVGISFISSLFAYETSVMSTIATIVVTFTSFMFLIEICKPMNFKRKAMCSTMIVIFIIAIVCMPEFFMVSSLTLGNILVTVIFVFISTFMLRTMFDICSKVFKYSK